MSRESEAARIREVYRSYDNSAGERAKRDPSNRGNVAIQAERMGVYAGMLSRHFGRRVQGAEVLDVGCGSGGTLAWLRSLGFNEERLAGVDLLPDRIASARLILPAADLRVADATELPFDGGSFDLVNAWTLFSSVLDNEVASAIATEILRVLRPGGVIGWYDVRINNRRNPNTRPLETRELALLFPGLGQRLVSITVIPPLARGLGVLTDLFYPALARVSALRSHYLGLLTTDA